MRGLKVLFAGNQRATRNVCQRRLGEGWLPAWGGAVAGLPSGSSFATLSLDR